jgi:hypothetical protein
MVSRASLRKTWFYILAARHGRVLDLTQPLEQISPLNRAEHGAGFRAESYVNVIGLVSRQGAGLERRA